MTALVVILWLVALLAHIAPPMLRHLGAAWRENGFRATAFCCLALAASFYAFPGSAQKSGGEPGMRGIVPPSAEEIAEHRRLEREVVAQSLERIASGSAGYDDYVIARSGLPGPWTAEAVSEARRLILLRVRQMMEAAP